MIDTHSNITIAYIGPKDLVPGLRAFLEEYGVALENFAGFLGGPRWARRVMQLRCDMSLGAFSPRAYHCEITAVLALLHAHVACDTELCASRRCLHTNGSDPYADNIRQLHDRLQSLVGSLSCADRSLFRTPA